MSPVDKGPNPNTEQELMEFGLTGKDEELDFDDQDRSLEEMGDGPEGDHLPGDEVEELEELAAKAPEGDPKKPDEPEKPDETPAEPEEEEEPEEPRDARGLRTAMLSERSRRQAAEAAAKQARDEIAAANARIDRILAERQQYQPQQPQQQAPPRPPPPDPVLDPEGYRAAIQEQMRSEMTARWAERSFAAAYEEHGKAFEEAYVALNRLNRNDPVDLATGTRIINSPDPAKALMRWHREQTFLREAGNDPAAYEAKMRERLVRDPDMVKAVLASLREQRDGGPQGAPRNITRLPPSLARARGGSSANEMADSLDNSDEGIMRSIMNGG